MHLMQTWKTHEIPERYKPAVLSWEYHHVNLEHEILDDVDLRSWVERRPWCAWIVDDPFEWIRVVDRFRYCYLFEAGGVYADVDFVCVRSMAAWFETHVRHGSVGLGSLIPPPGEERQSIPNALMASPQPWHPFWALVLAMAGVRRGARYIEYASGPILLQDAYALYTSLETMTDLRGVIGVQELYDAVGQPFPKDLAPVRIAEPDVFYPLSWGTKESNHWIRVLRDSPPGVDDNRWPFITERTLAYTWWEHSWGPDEL